MSVEEWADTYGIHLWGILWSSYRMLDWVLFEPTTTEFRSNAPTNWAFRQWLHIYMPFYALTWKYRTMIFSKIHSFKTTGYDSVCSKS